MHYYNNENCDELIKDLKRTMIKCGLSKREFAQKIGISYQTLIRFLKGDKVYLPSFSKIVDFMEKQKKKENHNNKK